MDGIIIKGVGGLYTIKTEKGFIECKARGIFRKNKMTPTIGDFVVVENDSISEIKPRKNILIRPTVANIDKLFIVVAVANPSPDHFYIDKLTVIADYYNIEPILIFNKLDLEKTAKIAEIYEKLSYKRYFLHAENEKCSFSEDAINLASELKGCTAALAGLSGVGKSTILNVLAEIDGSNEIKAEVGEISNRLQRGKHTTRHVELFSLCGGYIADTPGFGSLEFEYFDIKDRKELQYNFIEFKEYIGNCKFSDCIHLKDKGCCIREAVDAGQICPERYDSYCRMYEGCLLYTSRCV